MGNHRRTFTTPLGVILLLVALLSGAARGTARAEELTIYSGRTERLITPVLDAFAGKTGHTYRLLSSSSTDLLMKLSAEKDRTPADCFIAIDAATLERARQQNLLRPFTSEPVAAAVPAIFRAPDNGWVGVSLRTRVIVYNTNRVKAADIRSIFDLAGPRWKGRLAMTSSANESFQGGISVYLHERGRELVDRFLKGLKENAGSHVYAKHSQVVEAVAKGEVDVGLINHYYFYRHLAANPGDPVSILYPDQDPNGMGVAVNISGIGIVRHTKKFEVARQLVEFMASPEGQRIFAELNMEYPVNPKVSSHPSVRKRGTFKTAAVHMKELDFLRNSTIDLIEKIGLR